MDIFRITVFKLKVYYFFLIYSDFKRDRSTLIEVNGKDERQSSFWRWSSRLSLSDWAVLLRLLYALHLPPQTSRFTILKILFRENRKHVVLYIWYYILYCIIYIVIGYRYFKFLKKTPKQKITKWSFQFMISFDLLALFAQGSYNQEDLLCS